MIKITKFLKNNSKKLENEKRKGEKFIKTSRWGKRNTVFFSSIFLTGTIWVQNGRDLYVF